MPGMYDWQMQDQQGGMFGGGFRQGYYDYLKGQGYAGEMGPDMRAYAQDLRSQGHHPLMDYLRSMHPQMGQWQGGANVPGLGGLAGMFGGNPTPRPMQAQAPQGYDGSGINPGGMYSGLQGLAMARRPGQVIAR